MKTLVIEGEGAQYNLGQDVVPDASGQTFAVTDYKRAIDVPANAPARSSTRVPKFTYWQGLAAQRQVQGIDKAVGYNVAANGAASRLRRRRPTIAAPSCCAIQSRRCARRSIRRRA